MKPTACIVEQPAELFQFRYPSEGREKAYIEGANTTHSKKTYPKIEISNFVGDALIVISCVSDTEPYRQHPHKLTSNEGGCYRRHVKITESTKIIECKDINFLFTKKCEIVASLTERKAKNIDPFANGWDHMQSPKTINLHAVRLCVQVTFFNRDGTYAGECTMESNTIKNKKKSESPKIHEISATKSCDSGNDRIMLFCDKVQKDDIRIVFYDDSSDWKHELTTMNVHHQYGISFRTPPYKNTNMFDRKTVFMKLYRPSDQESSEPISFEYYNNLPSTQLIHKVRPKRHKNVPEVNKLKSTECPKPLNAKYDYLMDILLKGIENGVKREPHNFEKENNRPQSTNAANNNIPGNNLQNQQQQQQQQQHYPVYDEMYREPMSLNNHHSMNIPQPCPSNAYNGYQSNHYYQNTNTGVPVNNNIGDLYPINSSMPGYVPIHKYNQIPDAHPISSNTNHGYRTNNNYHPGLDGDSRAGVGNPLTYQQNVPVFNAADDFDPNQIENEPIHDDILTASMEKFCLRDIAETNTPT